MANHEHVTHTHGHDPAGRDSDPFLRRGRWVFWAFVLIAAAYLVYEHRAHVVGVLPFLIILACPLMHLFMHRGHGGHGGHSGHGGGDESPREEPRPDSSRDWRQ